ncbi:uncharacterized protein LOC121782018 [Salvia splendens]|uniref:uncharacterized protein LOC121782018 n=1 Tax=Salvia splendens TaxID=180675 RepID=UPI001C27836D|nr:uncharacterized protein LOC121782018 [Salvia splendens]
MEKLKAPDTASRLFFSTRPCAQSLIDSPAGWDEERRFASFWTILFEEALGAGYNKWEKHDMFFFPIWGERHQYVVCFDVPDGKMNFIEHTLAEPHALFADKYRNTPDVPQTNLRQRSIGKINLQSSISNSGSRIMGCSA